MRDRYTNAFIFNQSQESNQNYAETGFLYQLDSTFKSTQDDIRTNYLSIIDKLLQQTHCKRNNPEKKTTEVEISYNTDKPILKKILLKVNAYKVLTNDAEKKSYLNRIRLRSMASPYLNITDILADGHFFPFMIFSVFDLQTGESRMLEINFVEDVLHDRLKDHCCRSYHFSMLKRVNKNIT